jgi:hypothetical protein
MLLLLLHIIEEAGVLCAYVLYLIPFYKLRPRSPFTNAQDCQYVARGQSTGNIVM